MEKIGPYWILPLLSFRRKVGIPTSIPFSLNSPSLLFPLIIVISDCMTTLSFPSIRMRTGGIPIIPSVELRPWLRAFPMANTFFPDCKSLTRLVASGQSFVGASVPLRAALDNDCHLLSPPLSRLSQGPLGPLFHLMREGGYPPSFGKHGLSVGFPYA